MRFDTAAVLATLAAVCAADKMIVHTSCAGRTCNSSDGRFYTDVGSYKMNANKGCRRPRVPHMREICIDWYHGRGHFIFEGQNKRCLRMTELINYRCGTRCHRTTWEEINCAWRRDEGETTPGEGEVLALLGPDQASFTTALDAAEETVAFEDLDTLDDVEEAFGDLQGK